MPCHLGLAQKPKLDVTNLLWVIIHCKRWETGQAASQPKQFQMAVILKVYPVIDWPIVAFLVRDYCQTDLRHRTRSRKC